METGSNGTTTVPRSLSIDDLDKGERLIFDMVHQDMWQNIATNLGVEGKDHRQSARYVTGRTISQAEYDSLYVEDPVFAKIVDGIPEHGTRKWIKVTAQSTEGEEGSEDVDSNFGIDVLEALEDLDAQSKVFELWRLARLDGGAAMFLGADDGLPPEEPLNLDGIKVVNHLNVVTRFEIFPTDINEDITSPDFREPEFYMFTGRASIKPAAVNDIIRSTPMSGTVRGEQLENLGAQRVHHSRVIRMRGIVVAQSHGRTIQASRDAGTNSHVWGTPIVQRVYDDLRQYNTIFSHVEAGFKDLSQGVMGIKNLPEILANTQGNELLMKRMALIGLAASSFNMVLIDADKETYEKRPGAFAGIDQILLRFMEKLSSAAEIPMTKLFGMPPAGMSTDDESAEKTFNAAIANKQKLKLRDPLNRIIDALLHSREGPTEGNVPDSWKIGFIPLDEPNEAEQSTTAKTLAETDGLHLANGTLDEVEIRSRMKNDPDQPYTLSADRDAAMEEVGKPLEVGEAEGIAEGLGLTPPTGVDVDGLTPPTDDAAKTALNGAQIAAAIDITLKVSTGELPKESARAMLIQFFNMSTEEADAILAKVTEGSAAPTAPLTPPKITPTPDDGNTDHEEEEEEDDLPKDEF